jgi:hypothetical protein
MNPPPIPVASFDPAAIEKIRSGQRFILFSILLNLLVVAIAFLVPRIDFLVAIFGIINLIAILTSVILAIVGIIRLSSGLGYGIAARILMIISMFIPFVSLIVLFILSNKATPLLRSAGYKVGLLGAAPKVS